MLIPNLSDELRKRKLHGFHPQRLIGEKNDLAINDGISHRDQEWLTAVKELTESSKLTIVSLRLLLLFHGKVELLF